MDKEILDAYKKAGRIAAEALQHGKKLIKVGAKVVDACDAVEKFIQEKDAFPAFPAQISINSIAAHYCPDFEDPLEFKEGDVCKIDVGVHVNGYVGDNALTVDLGDNKDLTQASKDALNAALKVAKTGAKLGEIGKVIHEAIAKYDLSPIRNLSGHGLGQFKIHTDPQIPNFDTGDDTELKEDMAIAIEPFATNGYGAIFESSNPTIFSQDGKGKPRSQYSRDVLKQIETYWGLPFAKRWLAQKFGAGKTAFAIRELTSIGVLHAHPPLPEKEKGLVSQHEHTLIIKDKPIVTTLIDD